MDINKKEKLKLWLKKYDYFFYTLLVPLYILAFFIEERLIVSDYYVSYLPIDDKIPFIVWFIYPYILWYLFFFARVYFLPLRIKMSLKGMLQPFAFRFFLSLQFTPSFRTGRNSVHHLKGSVVFPSISCA